MTSHRTFKTVSLALLIALGLFAQAKMGHDQQFETLTVASDCSWCVEADFEKAKGMSEAVPGYPGGTVPNPT